MRRASPCLSPRKAAHFSVRHPVPEGRRRRLLPPQIRLPDMPRVRLPEGSDREGARIWRQLWLEAATWVRGADIHGRFIRPATRTGSTPRSASHYEQSGRLDTYLGDWHTHPGAVSGGLSWKDRACLKRIVRTPSERGRSKTQWRRTMLSAADYPEASVAIRVDLGAIFVSMELGKSTWLITSLSPGGGEKMESFMRPSTVSAARPDGSRTSFVRSRKMAFTFNANPKITQGPNCFLKSSGGRADGNSVAISGKFLSSAEPDPQDFTISTIDPTAALFKDVDLPGGDLSSRPLQIGSTAQRCRLACIDERRCVAFTYIKRKKECWLKGVVGAPRYGAGLVTGVKKVQSFSAAKIISLQ